MTNCKGSWSWDSTQSGIYTRSYVSVWSRKKFGFAFAFKTKANFCDEAHFCVHHSLVLLSDHHFLSRYFTMFSRFICRMRLRVSCDSVVLLNILCSRILHQFLSWYQLYFLVHLMQWTSGNEFLKHLGERIFENLPQRHPTLVDYRRRLWQFLQITL